MKAQESPGTVARIPSTRNTDRSIRSTKLQMLKSAHCQASLGREIRDVLTWVEAQNEAVDVRVQQSSFRALNQWAYREDSQSIRHDSGKFFSIDGIRVRTNWGYKAEWEQPIINQPEVGYLGFLVKEFEGVLHFLMQAKIEPGNVNKVQLSPTLQATRSNFTRVHKGRTPAYLEYFQQAKPHQILLDQLQSEQGARFLRKRNRNIVVWLEDEIEVKPNFIWLTLGQIKSLMAYDHVVNMDSRTVIAGLPYGSHDEDVIDFFRYLNGSGSGSGYGGWTGAGSGSRSGSNPAAGDFLASTLKEDGAMHTLDEIISKITHFKSVYDLEVTKTDLKSLDEWVYTDTEIYHQDRMFFRVIPVDVEIGNREVQRWS